MSAPIVMAIWNYTGKDLNATQTAIFVRMGWYASDAGRDIFPRVDTLVLQTKFSERTVREVLKHLRENNFIIVEAEATNTMPTKYKVNLARLGLTDEFTSRSNSMAGVLGCASCTPNCLGCASCTSGGAPRAVRGAPAAPINTIKHNIKNNNVVVDEKMLKLAEQANVTSTELDQLMTNFQPDQIAMQLKHLAKQKNISNPAGWMVTALSKCFKVVPTHTTEATSYNPQPLNPASHELWTEQKYKRTCEEALKMSDPNDWREQMLSTTLKKLNKGNKS
jgi:hypothetical protein